jgi:hypothetical protein
VLGLEQLWLRPSKQCRSESAEIVSVGEYDATEISVNWN